jgi:hypothetical protein
MVVAAGVGKGTAANSAQRMINEADLPPAGRAKTLRVSAVNTAATAPAPGRIKPVNEPVEAFGDARSHRQGL